jgi:FtsH-binding integral membrane protein
MCAFLKFILLKLQERFFLYGELQLFLDFINFFAEFLMSSLDSLDIV